MGPLYDHLVLTLSRYMSPILARSVVDRAVRRASVGARVLAPEHLKSVVPLLEAGTRLFVEPVRLLELQSELARFEGPAPPEPVAIDVRAEADITRARVAGKEMAQALGATSFSAQKVATIVSELARNIVQYTDGGRVEILPQPKARSAIRIIATDRGGGIPNLDEIMAGRYRSKTGLGSGLRGTKRLASSFEVETGSHGTRIVVEVTL